MKTFLQNLLIFFSLALCGLITLQWVRETQLRKDVQDLTNTVHDKMENIRDLNATVRRDEQEIQRLDGLRNQLIQTVKSNDLEIAGLRKEVDKTTTALERAQRDGEAFKSALQAANESILKQNEDIKKQNEEMAKMAEDRNQIVKRYNDMATNYNALVEKWNTQQEELKQAAATNALFRATNAPSRK